MVTTKTSRAGKAGGAGRDGRAGRTVAAVKAGGARPAKRGAAKPPKLPKAVASAVQAALDKKALDVVILDLRKAIGFTDYFVICSGTNPRQIQAIADAIEDTLKEDLGERPALVEGVEKSEWILLDYFNFVVHVFSRDCRAFFDIERLWGNAERYEFADAP